MQRVVHINLHSCIEISQGDSFDASLPKELSWEMKDVLEPRGILILVFILCSLYFIIFYFILQFVSWNII